MSVAVNLVHGQRPRSFWSAPELVVPLIKTRAGSGNKILFVGVSTAVKSLGKFFVSFREISFTTKWKHEQGYI